MWVLRTRVDDEARLTFRLRTGSIKTIGRAIRADFTVDVPLVSRLHCRLTATDTGQLEVIDLQSTNGTFVNDRKIRQAVLVAGDRLRVGRLELLISHEEKPN